VRYKARNGYKTIQRKLIFKVVNQVKKILIGSVLILSLLCVRALANDEFKWVKGDVAFVSEACRTPYVLFETASLYLTGKKENYILSGEMWADAIHSGECVSIEPQRARVELVTQIAIFPNLHPSKEGVDGELWEVYVMEKGSSGDFEATNYTVYVGLYGKKFTWSSEPDTYQPSPTGI
jgi:hypothetical protein